MREVTTFDERAKRAVVQMLLGDPDSRWRFEDAVASFRPDSLVFCLTLQHPDLGNLGLNLQQAKEVLAALHAAIERRQREAERLAREA